VDSLANFVFAPTLKWWHYINALPLPLIYLAKITIVEVIMQFWQVCKWPFSRVYHGF